MKCNNIRITGDPEEEERPIENLSDKMTENFPNLVKERDTQVLEDIEFQTR